VKDLSYRYLDHGADMAFESEGKTIESAFEEGAAALFNLMADITGVKGRQEREINLSCGDYEDLYYEWLSELLSVSGLEGILFSEFSVDISRNEDRNSLSLKGSARGEKIDIGRHDLKGEVKAITYLGLEVQQTPEGWKTRCVVDV